MCIITVRRIGDMGSDKEEVKGSNTFRRMESSNEREREEEGRGKWSRDNAPVQSSGTN